MVVFRYLLQYAQYATSRGPMPVVVRSCSRFPIYCRVVARVFSLFLLTSSFAHAQDPFDEISKQQVTDALERARVAIDEISKHQERYSRLHDEYINSMRRMNTVELHDARDRELRLLLQVTISTERTVIFQPSKAT
jgi:hypothetical protein